MIDIDCDRHGGVGGQRLDRYKNCWMDTRHTGRVDFLITLNVIENTLIECMKERNSKPFDNGASRYRMMVDDMRSHIRS